MYLKRVDIQGFKTFANKTVIDFDRGVTSVIGPNGCGKSNIVDAVRWALGEQSAKSLRGGEMIDVICNGNKRRRPSPFCEVCVIIDNQDQSLAIDQTEVSVRRKLYRNGDSEYYLNEEASRLKNIRELFMDTGIGAKTNTVIEQEQLTRLLQASSKERKTLIEEAAGISRFRQRRQESMHKLARVGDNMTRLKDIAGEVEKQKRSVAAQAAKANRFENLQKELRALKIDLAMIDLHHWIHQRLDFTSHKESLQDKIEELKKSEQRLQEELKSIDHEEQQMEVQMAKLQEQQASFFKTYHDEENKISEHKKRLEELAQDIETLSREIVEFTAELEQAEKATEELEINTDEHDPIEKLNQEISDLKNELKGLDEQIQSRRKAQEHSKNQEIELIQKKSALQNEIIKTESHIEYLTRRLTQVKGKSEELENEKLDAEQNQQDPKINEVLKINENDLEEQKNIQSRIAGIRESLKSLETELRNNVSESSSSQSKLEVLREMEEKFEGLGSGVRNILDLYVKGYPENQPYRGGVHGVVADLVHVPEDLVDAIEAALGPRMQNVVFSSAEEAKQAIQFLRQYKYGRATLLPLDRIRPRHKLDPKVLNYPGVKGEAFGLVGFDKKYENLFSFLLHGTLIVETIDHALAINKDHRVRIVTLNGDLISPEGAMTGGGKSHDAGLISRKVEITELEKLLEDSESRKNEKMEKHQSYLQKEEELELKSNNIGLRIKDRELKIKEAEQRKHVAKNDILRIQQNLIINQREREDLEAQIEQAQKELDLKINERQGIDQTPQSSISEQDKEHLAELEEKFQRLNAIVQDKELNRATMMERAQSDQKEREYKLEKAEDTRQRLSRRKDILANRMEEKEQRTEELKTREASFAKLSGQKNEQQSSFFELKEKREGLRKDRRNLQDESIRLTGLLRKHEHELSSIAVKEEGLRVKQEDLYHRFQEEMHINIEDLYYGRREAEDEFFQRESEFSSIAKEYALKIQEIEVKLSNLGNVNFEAIEELKELEDREAELGGQLDDLDGSFKKLDDFIKDLDKTCNDLFSKAFEAVNEHFKVMFVRMFGGGQGQLIIEQDVDPLEAGITISASPPGKSPKILSQLSGGEKVLTTIAFLFSIFLYKPSPFCILDEIDAPLDENNVDRFMDAIRSFTDQTQFLIVTHNRRTMSLSDVIHGVTMEESGISNCITVNLDDIEFHDNVESGYTIKGQS